MARQTADPLGMVPCPGCMPGKPAGLSILAFSGHLTLLSDSYSGLIASDHRPPQFTNQLFEVVVTGKIKAADFGEGSVRSSVSRKDVGA